ncbi:MAG: HK97 gp10 family phage protein [Plesiomonas sp.]
MPLKGVSQVRGRYQAVIKDIAETRTIKVVTAIVATGAAWAKLYTPVDTSALINSQRKSVSQSGSAIVGKVWYSQDYAVWLETKDTWKPRKKKTAKPHFLRSGFEDEGPQSEIKEIIRNGYKL